MVAVGGIIYFNFFSGPPKPAPPTSSAPPPPGGGRTVSETSAADTSSLKPVAKKSRGGLLPYGTGIETAVIEQDKFKNLRAATPFNVPEEELGRDDLFAR